MYIITLNERVGLIGNAMRRVDRTAVYKLGDEIHIMEYTVVVKNKRVFCASVNMVTGERTFKEPWHTLHSIEDAIDGWLDYQAPRMDRQ